MKLQTLLPIFMFVVFSGVAQNNYNQIYSSEERKPILIINDTLLASIDLLNEKSLKNIKEVKVFKDFQISDKKLFLKETNNGVVKVTCADFIAAKSLVDLNVFFGFDINNNIYVNGFLLKNKSYKISSESISEIKIISEDPLYPKQKVLSITIY